MTLLAKHPKTPGDRYVTTATRGDAQDRVFEHPEGVRFTMPDPRYIAVERIAVIKTLVCEGIAQCKNSSISAPGEALNYLDTLARLDRDLTPHLVEYRELHKQADDALRAAEGRTAARLIEQLRPIFGDQAAKFAKHSIPLQDFDKAIGAMPPATFNQITRASSTQRLREIINNHQQG